MLVTFCNQERLLRPGSIEDRIEARCEYVPKKVTGSRGEAALPGATYERPPLFTEMPKGTNSVKFASSASAKFATRKQHPCNSKNTPSGIRAFLLPVIGCCASRTARVAAETSAPTDGCFSGLSLLRFLLTLRRHSSSQSVLKEEG